MWTPQTDDRLRELKRVGWTAQEMAGILTAELGVDVSLHKVNWQLKRLGLCGGAQKNNHLRGTAFASTVAARRRSHGAGGWKEESIQGVTIEDIGPNACRWPLNDPALGADDFRFCGCEAVPGRSYCHEHLRRAYVGIPKLMPTRPMKRAA